MSFLNFFVNMLEEQYGVDRAKNVLNGLNVRKKVTLRVNRLKTNIGDIEQKLTKAGIEFERVKWSNEALVINNVLEKDIEKLSIYENGEIYMQSLSSMLPPIVLNPQENMDILDMAAAPGGKTTQIAALTNNKAHITACELNKIRAQKLKYNIEKQGATSVFVMETDSRRLNNFFLFDSILLDSPCSGSGTLNFDDKNIEKYFTKELIKKCKKIQLELLKKGLNVLKRGKELVYSTCSILECENEDIINKVLNEGKCEIVPISFRGMEDIPMLKAKIPGTLLVMPNEKYEGFFVAKLRKK